MKYPVIYTPDENGAYYVAAIGSKKGAITARTVEPVKDVFVFTKQELDQWDNKWMSVKDGLPQSEGKYFIYMGNVRTTDRFHAAFFSKQYLAQPIWTDDFGKDITGFVSHFQPITFPI